MQRLTDLLSSLRSSSLPAYARLPTSARRPQGRQRQRGRAYKLVLLGCIALFSALVLLSASPGARSLLFPLSSSPLSSPAPTEPDAPFQGCAPPSAALEPREKAAILLLLREQDLAELLPTLENFEEKFNAQFRYPYVLLSTPDEPPLSPHFRSEVSRVLPPSAEVEYAQVPEQDWQIPEWLNKTEVREGFERQEGEGVQYAGREGYHHMCRFYSGLFARQEVLQGYEWYWRLEPGVRFYCKISYDPFRFLRLRNQVYGFVITIVETPNTIPTLFSHLLSHFSSSPSSPSPPSSSSSPQASTNLWPFFTHPKHGSPQGQYNMCHFWTNFEIGSLDFFRGGEYQAVFESLDRAGGFYEERWGDAPVRSLALGGLVGRERVHYFEDFAYKHDWFMHCPSRPGIGCECDCPPFGDGYMDIDRDGWYSCLPEWRALQRGALDP